MKKPIYLDYMATTPVDPEVTEKMLTCLQNDGYFGNPASITHSYGWESADLIDQARQQVAHLINADPQEIIWTSGATEANNLAIKGAATFYQRKGKHIITLATEHKSVLDSCAYLENNGFLITYIKPEAGGILNLEQLKAAIREDTVLISVMHVNNETGVIQDIESIAKLSKAYGILVHCDAVQSVGKLDIDLKILPIDLLSMAGHKLYGPKGIGALYVRRHPRIRLNAQIHGGGHEQGLRSGTLPTHQIVGMGAAFAIAKQRLVQDRVHCQQLMTTLSQGLTELDAVYLNGDRNYCIPNCLNLSFGGVDNDALLTSLPELALSDGSACNAVHHEPSHVLMGMGLSRQRANQAVRFSVGRFTTMEDIRIAIDKVTLQVQRLRTLSPIWC